MPTIIPLTKEETWLTWLDGQLKVGWQPPMVPTLVVAPHPDDETLGTGGLIARLRGAGVPVSVAAVTDGEHAYGKDDAEALGRLRVEEQREALARLGVDTSSTHRLLLPDRDVSLHEEELAATLRKLVSAGMHLLAPWPGDFHPDHEAAGRAAQMVAGELGLPLTFYVFWTWHRGSPSTLGALRLEKLALSKTEMDTREHALQAYASQLEHVDGQPILSEELLRPARRSFEVYLRSC